MNKNKRYSVKPEVANGWPIYVVVDNTNGRWVAVRDCQLWADKKAQELNEAYSQYIKGFNEAKKMYQKTNRWIPIEDEPYNLWECGACGLVLDARDSPPKYCEDCGSRNYYNDGEE